MTARLVVGMVLAAALLSSQAARAQTPRPSPSPTPRAYTDEDLKRYAEPKAAPTPAPTAEAGASAPAPSSAPAAAKRRPYRRKPQRIPSSEGPRASEGGSSEAAPETETTAPPRSNGDAPPQTAVAPPPAQAPSEPGLPSFASQASVWGQRAEAARTAIQNARSMVARRDEEAANIARRLMLSPDTNEALKLRAAQAAAEQAAAGARTELAAAERALGDLEEEARRQNIPPGWLREP